MKKTKVAVMVAMLSMMVMMAGCGDGSTTAMSPTPPHELTALEEYNMSNHLFGAARPTAIPGQMEVVTSVPTIPPLQPYVWFTITRTDVPTPVLATVSTMVAANPANGETRVLVNGLNQGGDYVLKMSTAIPGTNPPQAVHDSTGNPGKIWEWELTFKATDMAGLWP